MQTTIARRLVAGVARHPLVRRAVIRNPLASRLASRFVAGETVDAAIATALQLRARGLATTLNLLGTHVRTAEEAALRTDDVLDLIRRIAATQVDAGVSIKLTQLGLDVSVAVARGNVERILREAADRGVFVRIDMEESRYVDQTIAMFDDLRDSFGADAVGIALQSYLRQRRRDVADLAARRSRIRIVKGGYWESPEVALHDRADINAAFLEDAATLLRIGHGHAIATHDPLAIAAVGRMATDLGRAPGEFEFEMLYGVHQDRARRLVSDGQPVRVYVPFGPDWYAYVLGCVRQVLVDRRRNMRRQRGA